MLSMAQVLRSCLVSVILGESEISLLIAPVSQNGIELDLDMQQVHTRPRDF